MTYLSTWNLQMLMNLHIFLMCHTDIQVTLFLPDFQKNSLIPWLSQCKAYLLSQKCSPPTVTQKSPTEACQSRSSFRGRLCLWDQHQVCFFYWAQSFRQTEFLLKPSESVQKKWKKFCLTHRCNIKKKTALRKGKKMRSQQERSLLGLLKIL